MVFKGEPRADNEQSWLISLLDPGKQKGATFYLLLPISRTLLYRILQCEAVAARICSSLQQGLTVARLVSRSVGKNLCPVENAKLRKKQSVSCCIIPKFRPRLRLFFIFSLALVFEFEADLPACMSWLDSWGARKERPREAPNTPDYCCCLPWWRCITGRRWLAAPGGWSDSQDNRIENFI